MQRSTVRLIAGAVVMALLAPVIGPAAPAAAGPPPTSGCTLAVMSGLAISHRPSDPGAQSLLEAKCFFDDRPVSEVSSSYTLHDFPVAQWHNGAARTVLNVAVVPLGATTFNIGAQASTGLTTWVNRPITMVPVVDPPVPNTTVLQVRTFVKSITAAGLVTLNLPTIDTNGGAASAAIPIGTEFKIDNTIGRSFVDADVQVAPSPANQITSATANFTAADNDLSVTGTNIPPHTVATVVSSTTITLSSTPTGAATGQTITIGGTLLNTTTRLVEDGALTNATERVVTPSARFTSDDVGLPVYGVGIAAGAVITAVLSLTTVTLGCSIGGCVGNPVTADATGVTVTIGDPSVTAPSNGDHDDTLGNMGFGINLSAALVAGADACVNEIAEGLAVVGEWNNPRFFEGTGIFNNPPSTGKVIGQIYFTDSTVQHSAYVVERRISGNTPVDPLVETHYDVVFPFVPWNLAMCPSTATSKGLYLFVNVPAQTASVQNLPDGTGKPGSAQVRSILPTCAAPEVNCLPQSPQDGTPAYTSVAILNSQDMGVPWSGGPEFQRVCVWTGTTSCTN